MFYMVCINNKSLSVGLKSSHLPASDSGRYSFQADFDLVYFAHVVFNCTLGIEHWSLYII